MAARSRAVTYQAAGGHRRHRPESEPHKGTRVEALYLDMIARSAISISRTSILRRTRSARPLRRASGNGEVPRSW